MAICNNCGKWYLTNPVRMHSTPEFVNQQQRKFYFIKRVLNIVRITVVVIVLLLIFRSVMGD